MAVVIASNVLEAILAAAAADPQREVCGLLFGGDEVILAARATANASPHPTDSFEIDPQALFAAIRAERAGGPRLVGHYHSHPAGAAIPSARDAAAAEPGRLWLIVASGEARLWRSLPGGGFGAVPLLASAASGCIAGT